MSTALTTTQLPNLLRRGKVRDIYDADHDALLFVATDRISAFDLVLPTGIPEKGIVLNELSRFWFEKTKIIVPNHFIAMSYEREWIVPYTPELPEEIARRSMLVRRLHPIPVECVVRGYLAGSALAEYHSLGTIGGEAAPPGLRESERLPSPVFTPTTKADQGHDEPITLDEMGRMIGEGVTRELARLSVELYSFAHRYALSRGIIIADTKFEFGMDREDILLIDEALTPDSSRFWMSDDYSVGRSQDSLDKQFVRDWLTRSGWNREPPAPSLPAEVVEQTARRYKEAYQRLTGVPLP